MPATPTSWSTSTLLPKRRATPAASAATGASAVPAETTATVPRPLAGTSLGPNQSRRASGS
jgi:hypothetical protein